LGVKNGLPLGLEVIPVDYIYSESNIRCFFHFHRYGDRAPLSYKGRIFAIAWILFGLIVIAITMAMLTTALTTVTLKSEPKLYGSKASSDLETFKNS